MARLRLIDANGIPHGSAWDVGAGLTLGRSEDCDVVLADDAVSRHHARLTLTASGVLLEDLGSANGTWVGRERVEQRYVPPGEAFRVGETWFALEAPSIAGARAGVPAAPVIPPARPTPRGWSVFPWIAAAGCLVVVGVVVFAGLGGGIWWWISRTPEPSPRSTTSAPNEWRAGTDLPSTEESPARGAPVRTGKAPAAKGVPASVAMSEAAVLQFELRVATNPVLGACASMPAAWEAPALVVPVRASVADDGSFAFEQDLRGEAVASHVNLSGTWKNETLDLKGDWTTRSNHGSAEQRDRGRFQATGQRVLGTWFGDRVRGTFESSFAGGPPCTEAVDNGYSTVAALVW